MSKENKAPIALEENFVTVVKNAVDRYRGNRELDLPPNYSVSNALKSAWLLLQGVEDKHKNKVLKVCTKESIVNSMMEMVVQGLNAAKNQGYFIAYGKSLTFQPSYFGAINIVKRVTGCEEVVGRTVYEDDELEVSIDKNGHTQIDKHTQNPKNIGSDKIIGAYAIISWEDGKRYAEYMTIEQIKKAWNMGPMNGKSKAHKNFPDQMAPKTVINRLCKAEINSSDDQSIISETHVMSNNRTQQAIIDEESEEEAGKKELTLEEPEDKPKEKETPPESKPEKPNIDYDPETGEVNEGKQEELDLGN